MHQLNLKDNDPVLYYIVLCCIIQYYIVVLLFKNTFRHWNCFLSSVATGGKDGHGLKLEKCWVNFFKLWCHAHKNRHVENWPYSLLRLLDNFPVQDWLLITWSPFRDMQTRQNPSELENECMIWLHPMISLTPVYITRSLAFSRVFSFTARPQKVLYCW